MPISLEEFYKGAQNQVLIFNNFVQQHKLINMVIADHLGYKCSSSEEFYQLREIFEKNSNYIYQSIISKRRIAIIKLKNPIKTNCGLIYFLELSDQKPDGIQKSGFDHLEFFPKINSVEDTVRYLENRKVIITKTERPHHVTYDTLLSDVFKVRIEAESLIKKITREEIKTL